MGAMTAVGEGKQVFLVVDRCVVLICFVHERMSATIVFRLANLLFCYLDLFIRVEH